ncbi:hypothetical protein V5799_010569 [Amblyomma americanum]|uniref:UBC core domain-containing protein n=1 Tax=Amblyomma americanum TaxID=6943 RepID=A0AAQ4EJA0_AMBAM
MSGEVPASYFSWNPLEYAHKPSPQTMLRVKRDIVEFRASPPVGIFISPEEGNFTRIHVLIVGSTGT